MDLHVGLADGTTQTLSISSSSTIEDIIETIANNNNGLKAVADCLSEFSLAHRDKNSEAWINVSWLDPTLPVLEQAGKTPSNTTLLFRKKYFSTNDDLRYLDSSPVLHQNIYAQLRHTFIAGLYKCTTFQAVQIAAMVAKVEFSGARLGVAGTLRTAGSLKQVLPAKFSGVPGIEQLIVKATRNISHLSEEATQKAFIQRLQRLETFGLAFFTVIFEEGKRRCEGLLGVGAESIFKIDREEMESLAQWETATLSNYYFDRNSFTMVFGSDEYITMATMHGHMISEFLSGVKEVSCNGKINKMVKPLKNDIVAARRRLDHNEPDGRQQKTPPPKIAPKPRLKPSRTQPELRNLQQHRDPNMQSISDTNLVLPPPSPLSKKPRPPPKPDSARKLEASSSTRHISPIRKPPYPDPLTQVPPLLSPTTPSHHEPVEYLVPILPPASTSSEPDYAEVNTFSSKGQRFAAPASPPGGLSRQRGGRHLAVKRRASNTAENSSPSPPLGRHGTNSPPLTKEKAQGPPRPPLPRLPLPQGRSSRRTPPPPQEQAPSPPPHRKTPPPPQERAPSPPQERPPSPPPHRRAPPPPQERAPSPPQERPPSPPHRKPPLQNQSRPPPRERAPPPPQERAPPPPQERGPPFSPTESIYDTVSDDPTELSTILGDADLLKDVRWSQSDENPIYDLVAASEAQTLLRNSDVTYKMLNQSFKRQMKLRQAKEKSPPAPRRSGGNGDQVIEISMFPPKPAERTNLNQPRLPGITKRLETNGSDRQTASPPPVPQRTYKQASSYAQPQIRIITGAAVREVEDGYTNPEELHPTSERHRFHSDSVVNSKPQVLRVKNSREVAGYAIPEDVMAVGMRRKLKSEGDLKKALVEGEGETEEAGGKGEPQKVDPRPPKPPRLRKRKEEPFQKLQRRVEAVVGPDTGKQKARLMKPGEIFKDYATLLKEFRMFAIKLPNGVVHLDLVNLSSPVQKLTTRLCQLLHAEDPDMYSLYVEGAALTNVTEHDDSSSRGPSGRGRPRTTALDHFTSLNFSTSLPDQGPIPVLLDPRLSFRDHGITTTRILALKPKPSCRETLPRYQILVPDWVRFHQCWLNVVQGGQPCSLQDAIKLAALQYQAYFLDRTELNSVIGFCKSTEFLPLEYSSVKGVEEKVFSEQQLLEGYTHKQAQDCYIHASCSLPTYGSVFFPCKEVKKRFLQNNKLTPILIGISREGIIRVDPKTKEVLDLWQYQVLRNWGFSGSTFVLDFADTSYPIKTNQGRWIADLISFHIEAIARDEGNPPPPPHEVFHPTSSSPPPLPRGSSQQGIVEQHYEMNTADTMERIYEKLFPVSSLPLEQPQFSSFSPGSHNSPEPTLLSSGHHHYYILEQNSSHNVASPTSSEERVYDLPEAVIPLESTVQNHTDGEDPTYDDVIIPVVH